MKIGNTTGIESEFAIALCVIRRAGPASSSLEFDLDKGGDLSVTGRPNGFWQAFATNQLRKLRKVGANTVGIFLELRREKRLDSETSPEL